MFLKLGIVWERVKGTIHGLVQLKNLTLQHSISPFLTMLLKAYFSMFLNPFPNDKNLDSS